MATSTTNLDLSKPAYSDIADIAVLNSNMDKIDTFAGTTNTAITNLGVYTMSSSQELLTVARDTTICPENTVRWINPRNGTVSGGATQYGMACVTKRYNSAISVRIYSDYGTEYFNYWDNTNEVWVGWDKVAKASETAKQLASIPSTGSATYTVASNSRLVIYAMSTSQKGMWLIYTANNGAVTAMKVEAHTDYAISSSAVNTLTLTGPSGANVFAQILLGSISD